MGTFNDEAGSRIPEVDLGDTKFTWRYYPEGTRAANLTVTHVRGGAVEIAFGGDDIDVPLRQVRWLAEVLLQLTDRYREVYAGAGGDDYTRPSRLEDRR